jgi:hypothetical protein
MTARVLLFVQRPDDARPKCAGGTSVDPYGPLSFHGGPLTKLAGGRWGSSVQAIAQRRAARWWLVECENADAGRAIISRGSLIVSKHERCDCGHCRCEHDAGYGACCAPRDHGTQTCRCVRYTWPGPGASMSEDHAGRILASGGANK